MSKTVQELIEQSQAQFFGKDTVSMFYKNIFIPSFARDIVLFGKEQGLALVEQYGLTAEDLAQIIELPLFKAEVRNLRILMDEGVLITTQMKAASALDGMVDLLAERALDPDIKPGELVKIVQELRSMAMLSHTTIAKGGGSAVGDAPTSAAGMTINFSFGDPNNLPPIREPINITPERQQIEEEGNAIDVDFSETE